MVVNSTGREIRTLEEVQPSEGTRLQLTIDYDVQKAVEDAFAVSGFNGAAVILDPNDGGVLAFASVPQFDPNAFAAGIDRNTWTALMKDDNRPLNDRAIQGTYSPGSTFKMAVALAALEEGIITPDFTVNCQGFANFYGRDFKCWKHSGHGSMDLAHAIQNSCDVYFYALGQRLGIERIARYARLFGLGRPTGIEIDGEKAGLVPDDGWSRAARGHPWYAGETISVAIGQGPLLVTPLQIAALFAATANGGHLVHPHLVRHQDGADPPSERLPVSEQSMATIREALWAVVNEQGTGAAAFVPGLDVAGKTGTVQVSARGATEEHMRQVARAVARVANDPDDAVRLDEIGREMRALADSLRPI